MGNKVEITESQEVSGDIDSLPFLDDEGNPLDSDGNVIIAKEPEEEKPKRTRKRRAKKTETVDADA